MSSTVDIPCWTQMRWLPLVARKLLVAMTYNQRRLAAVARTDPYYAVACMAVRKVKNAQLLKTIASDTSIDWTVRGQALEVIKDPSLTLNLLLDDSGAILDMPFWLQRCFPSTGPTSPEAERKLAIEAKAWRIRLLYCQTLDNEDDMMESLMGMVGLPTDGIGVVSEQLKMIARFIKRPRRVEQTERLVREAKDPMVRAMAAAWLYIERRSRPDIADILSNEDHGFNVAVREAFGCERRAAGVGNSPVRAPLIYTLVTGAL